jgi:hypothetical protein
MASIFKIFNNKFSKIKKFKERGHLVLKFWAKKDYRYPTLDLFQLNRIDSTEGSPNLSVYRARTVTYRSVAYRTVPYRTLPFSERDSFGRPRSVPYFFDRFP